MKPRKNIRIIKQKTDSDCAICCFTMLTGLPYKQVLKTVGDAYVEGKGMFDSRKSLLRLGYKQKKIPVKGVKGGYRLEDIDFKKIYKSYEISAEYFKEIIWGRRALLSVPSLNKAGGSHMIYWHYDRIYDPSNKKTYKEFKEIKPTEIVIFLEKPA